MGCASGLYIAPQKTRFFAKKILIYDEDNALSDTSTLLSNILAKEIKYEVLGYKDIGRIIRKSNWDSKDLSYLNVAIIIKLRNISFLRDVVKKQPFIQIRVGKSPPLWQWVFLSAINADFEVYDTNTGNILLRGTFPPSTFRQYSAKYGIGRKSSCPKKPRFNFKSWAMSKDAIFFSQQYIVLYVGEHSEFEYYKPKITDSFFKAADLDAIKKLVSYIAKSIPTEEQKKRGALYRFLYDVFWR